jgi:hypothetical protein
VGVPTRPAKGHQNERANGQVKEPTGKFNLLGGFLFVGDPMVAEGENGSAIQDFCHPFASVQWRSDRFHRKA